MQSTTSAISDVQSPCRIHFVSFDKLWVDAMTALFAGCTNVTVTQGNIKLLPIENTVFVSPANSLGYMDGGIDWVLSREMFPGLQTRVQLLIRSNGHVNAFGRRYLPVGSALTFRIGTAVAPISTSLIVAPTMFQPRDVSHTRNAYWSFLAALTAFEKFGAIHLKQTLVATSHCCGYGCMDPVESANQMYAAYVDFCAGVGKRLDIGVGSCNVEFPLDDIDDGSQGLADTNAHEGKDIKEIYINP